MSLNTPCMAFLLIAHRGLSGLFPENTMEAFRAAFEAGARAVEFDVQQTADGELIVIHDTDLKRLAGLPVEVGKLKYKEVAGVDVGSWFDPRFGGARVPRLDEVLAAAPEGVEIHLEIKQPRVPYAGIEGRVLEALRGRPGVKGRTVVSSFHYPTLKALRSLDPGVRLGWLRGKEPFEESLAMARRIGAESVHVSGRGFSPAWPARARAAGLKLYVYTVDRPKDIRRLAQAGADGVFTNFANQDLPDGC